MNTRHALRLSGLVLALTVPAALADSYADRQAQHLDAAAGIEDAEADTDAGDQFRALAAQVRASGRAATVADLPQPWQTEIRKAGSHGKMYFGLVELESKLASIRSRRMDCAANHDALARAEVNTFLMRHELSEFWPHVNPGRDLVDETNGLLVGLRPCVTDRDGDGINDDVDKCPDQPEDKDGFEDTDGCPEPGPVGDRDGDGIKDDVDRCPDVPETVNGVLDSDGCPDEMRAVYFDTDSSRLDGEAIDAIRANFLVLQDAPEARVRLVGNADDRATDEYNESLGMRRADAVRRYLVEVMGLSPARLETTSWGESRPVGDTSPEGRAKNRRVDFTFIR